MPSGQFGGGVCGEGAHRGIITPRFYLPRLILLFKGVYFGGDGQFWGVFNPKEGHFGGVSNARAGICPGGGTWGVFPPILSPGPHPTLLKCLILGLGTVLGVSLTRWDYLPPGGLLGGYLTPILPPPGLILLFYLIFYGFLAGLFALTMWVMLQSVDPHVPKYQDRLATPGAHEGGALARGFARGHVRGIPRMRDLGWGLVMGGDEKGRGCDGRPRHPQRALSPCMRGPLHEGLHEGRFARGTSNGASWWGELEGGGCAMGGRTAPSMALARGFTRACTRVITWNLALRGVARGRVCNGWLPPPPTPPCTGACTRAPCRMLHSCCALHGCHV